MQERSELFEDMERTFAVPGNEVELAESKYPEMGQVYLDPVAVYMENFFFTKPTHISSMSVVFLVYQEPCKQHHARNFYQTPLLCLSMKMVIKN